MKEASAAVEALFLQHLDTVFSYVLYRVPNRVEAEDITAETFAAAAAAFDGFRRESSEKVWLLGIARQKVAEAARRYERSRAREQPECELSERQREILGLLLEADVARLPEDAALRREAREVMRALLAALPEAQREALLLQTEEGLSIREVAKALGRSEAAANSLLQRARATLLERGRFYFGD